MKISIKFRIIAFALGLFLSFEHETAVSIVVLLTNTCNTCHQATRYEFNVITVPNTPAFGNQQF